MTVFGKVEGAREGLFKVGNTADRFGKGEVAAGELGSVDGVDGGMTADGESSLLRISPEGDVFPLPWSLDNCPRLPIPLIR